jgi:hypothetical protein
MFFKFYNSTFAGDLEDWLAFYISSVETQDDDTKWQKIYRIAFEGDASDFQFYKHQFIYEYRAMLRKREAKLAATDIARIKACLVRAKALVVRSTEGPAVRWVTIPSIIMDYYTILRIVAPYAPKRALPCRHGSPGAERVSYAVLQAGSGHIYPILLTLMQLQSRRRVSNRRLSKQMRILLQPQSHTPNELHIKDVRVFGQGGTEDVDFASFAGVVSFILSNTKVKKRDATRTR